MGLGSDASPSARCLRAAAAPRADRQRSDCRQRRRHGGWGAPWQAHRSTGCQHWCAPFTQLGPCTHASRDEKPAGLPGACHGRRQPSPAAPRGRRHPPSQRSPEGVCHAVELSLEAHQGARVERPQVQSAVVKGGLRRRWGAGAQRELGSWLHREAQQGQQQAAAGSSRQQQAACGLPVTRAGCQAAAAGIPAQVHHRGSGGSGGQQKRKSSSPGPRGRR